MNTLYMIKFCDVEISGNKFGYPSSMFSQRDISRWNKCLKKIFFQTFENSEIEEVEASSFCCGNVFRLYCIN